MAAPPRFRAPPRSTPPLSTAPRCAQTPRLPHIASSPWCLCRWPPPACACTGARGGRGSFNECAGCVCSRAPRTHEHACHTTSPPNPPLHPTPPTRHRTHAPPHPRAHPGPCRCLGLTTRRMGMQRWSLPTCASLWTTSSSVRQAAGGAAGGWAAQRAGQRVGALVIRCLPHPPPLHPLPPPTSPPQARAVALRLLRGVSARAACTTACGWWAWASAGWSCWRRWVVGQVGGQARPSLRPAPAHAQTRSPPPTPPTPQRALSRVAFGRPLAAHQGVRLDLAHCRLDVDSARQVVVCACSVCIWEVGGGGGR